MLNYRGKDAASYAAAVDRWSTSDMWKETTLDLLKYLYPLGRMMDIGCNMGRMADLVDAVDPNALYTGVDLNAEAIEKGITVRPNKHLLHFDGLHLPAKTSSLNTIVLIHTLPHVKYDLDLLDECYRVLRPRGGLGVIVPNRWHDWLLLPRNLWTGYRGDPTTRRIYTEHSIRRLLVAVGFEDLEFKMLGRPAYSFTGNGSRQWIQVTARR